MRVGNGEVWFVVRFGREMRERDSGGRGFCGGFGLKGESDL